jgi:hypothetical protein
MRGAGGTQGSVKPLAGVFVEVCVLPLRICVHSVQDNLQWQAIGQHLQRLLEPLSMKYPHHVLLAGQAAAQ